MTSHTRAFHRSVLCWAAVTLLFTQVPAFAAGPTVVNVQPAPGTLNELQQITVTFSAPVTGVLFNDLLLNGVPATRVTGANAVWTFEFDQPPYGVVNVSWDENHLIYDQATPPARFDASALGATWQYSLVDITPPTLSAITPAADTTVRQLSQVEVVFSELVTGVDAADLLINGAPATGLQVRGGGKYVFSFTQPPTGAVQVAWAPSHAIADFAAVPNAFAGGSWSYVLAPGFGLPTVRINEFVAANTTGLKDENNEPQDWVELFNYGAQPVNLAGWSLSDDVQDPGRWVFPATNINPGQYLVVFASAKDRRVAGARLHTNFKLNANGDYLGLFNAEFPRVAVSEFNPEFPEQRNDYSFGLDTTNVLKYFRQPTPGAVNGPSTLTGVTPPPHFNVQRGLFDSPFQLILSCTAPGAAIRYTLDGSEPTETAGLLYSGNLRVTNTSVVRAIAAAPSLLPSATVTHSYIFIDSVLRQPNNPPNYPAGPTAFTGYPSDYEMDPEIVTNSTYGPMMKDALKALPTLIIATSISNMFSANGIYVNPEPPAAQRASWERPCSVEFIETNGATGFQVNCGIRIQGNASRTPQKTPKHPFRLMFRGEYGSGRLEYPVYPDSPVASFDTIVLRADFNNSWVHWDAGQRLRGSKMRDAWVKESFRDMGQPSGHTRHFHLYINGLYWGVYDFGERIDAEFAASYYGGTATDYDVMVSKPTEAIDGDMVAYNQMLNMVRYRDMRVLTNYVAAHQHLDITNYIDYILLNTYGANQDWGNDGNWNAFRRRTPAGPFKYVTWDGEQLIVNVGDNRINSTDFPSHLHTNLLTSAEYRLAFADRAQKHLFNDGALTPTASLDRWNRWAARLEADIVAETARWGDYRRDVHSWQTGPYLLYTLNDHWIPEVNRMRTSYFPQRGANYLQQLRAVGLYPTVSAPVFSQHGGRVARGYQLTITATNSVYFTTNGVDPRVFGTAQIAPQAVLYSGPIVLGQSMLVKARVLLGTNWSALTEAQFNVDQLGFPLRITEIMYNPIGGDAYEFIELQNVGSLPVDVGGFSLSGVTYTFPPQAVIQAGEVIVLGSVITPANWNTRYPGVTAFGRFDANLSNGGEKLALLDAQGNVVTSVDYDDENGWPKAADGAGPSLEVIDAWGNPDDPANWQAWVTNGTPGVEGPHPGGLLVGLNEVMAENLSAVTNNGAFPDWVELRNSSPLAFDISGYSLSDDGNPRKFVFPTNTTVPANGYLVIWCDSPTNNPLGLHTGFALGRTGDSIFLYNSQTVRVDAISFGPQIANYSFGRIGQNWQLTDPTPSAPNQPATTASVTNLVINEWLANAAPGGSDWIELFNKGTAPVALQGIYVGSSNLLSQVASLSFIPAGGFVQLFADEQPGPDHLDFKLPAAGGRLVLYDPAGAELDRVNYTVQLEGVTQGRLPDGGANIRSFPGSPSPRAPNYVLTYSGPVLTELMAVNSRAVTNLFGGTPDWVEIYNPSPAPADLSGMRLSTDPNEPAQWTFPAGVSLPAQSRLVVWFDTSQPASTTATGPLNTGVALSGSGGNLLLFNNAGQPVDTVAYGFQVPDLSIGRVDAASPWLLLAQPTPGSPNAAPAALGSPAALRLNEWMAAPQDGNDWFEVFNSSELPVALAGLFVSDNLSIVGSTKYSFPALSFVGPLGAVEVVADSDVNDGFNHVNFNLQEEGEALRLSGSGIGVIDSIYFGLQAPGVSQGRLPDGSPRFIDFPNSASPGESNYLPLRDAVVNEVLTHTDPPLEDAIEIYNAGSRSLDLSGWFLSDDVRDLRHFRIPSGTILPAGGFLVFYEYQFSSGAPGSFALSSARGGRVFLSAADASGSLTGERSVAVFGAAPNGVTWGRHTTSSTIDFTPMSSRTLGAASPATIEQFRAGGGTVNAYPAVGPVVINEVMYHPAGDGTNDNVLDEYIELYNFSSASVPLYDPMHPTNTWKLGGGVTYQFPQGVSLPAIGSLLVVNFDPVTNAAQATMFRAKYGLTTQVPLYGPYSGKLGNGGEELALFRPDQPQPAPSADAGFVPSLQVDRVVYDDFAPWPVSGDGDGNSLQRRVAAEYGNEPLNWVAAAPTPGTANPAGLTRAPEILVQPVSRTVSPGAVTVFFVDAIGTQPLAYQWRLNGAPIPGQTAAILTLAGVTPAQIGDYSVTVANSAGSITSSVARLNIGSLPVISSHPPAAITNAGATLVLPVTASGEGPLTYEWRRDGMLVEGASNATLIIPNVQLSDSGKYSVLVGNAAGVVVSAVAPVEIYQGVEILLHPQGLTNNPGATVTFSVVATNAGSGSLQYQWRLNGTILAGQTSPSLTLSNVQLEDSGDYQVLVSDNRGSVLSQPATLVVLVRPIITLHPDGSIVAVGDRATITAGARGTMPIDYRWRRISTYVITNRVYTPTDTLVIENVQTNDSGFYTVALANQAGTASALTSNAFLTVVIPPTNQLAQPGANVQISAEAYGRTYIQYQWQFKGVNLPGATNSSLTLTNVQAADSGPYTVVVSVNTNRVIAPASFTAQVQVGAPGISLSQPAMQSNRTFQFLVNGAPGQVLWIDVSTNIMPWSVQQSFRYTNGAGPFVDPPGAAPVPRRFYRARTAE